MNIEIEEDDEIMKLRLEDANDAIANTLRRSIMTKVPTLSIQNLEIVSNESGLFDEVLANRVGQIPFTIPKNVDEEDIVNIALKQEGPGTVQAEDLKADNDEAEPVNPETVIVDLKEGQRLEFEAKAKLGTGKEHAKHQGGTVGYEKEDEEDYIFQIESTSGYQNRDLLLEAINQVQKELDEFEDAVKSL